MNKAEIEEMLLKGVKITHTSFTDTEWIKKHPKSTRHYIDENKNVLDIKDFWKYRTAPRWDKNWLVCPKQ